jgi:hypothetical protein
MVIHMLNKIEDQELNAFNNKGMDDLSVLRQVFNINQLMQQSKSEHIKNYFQNYYNDLQVVVLRRDFIDLYPKIKQIETDWKNDLPVMQTANLSLSDNQIEAVLSGRKNKTIEDFQASIKEIGNYISNDTLKNIEKSKVSQNEFVNQKTVYNIIASETLNNNKHLFNLDIMSNYTIGNNDIFRADTLKETKKWKPTQS